MDANTRIENVQADPCASYWLKDALRAAMNRDALDAARDAQWLAQLLTARSDEMLGNVAQAKGETA